MFGSKSAAVFVLASLSAAAPAMAASGGFCDRIAVKLSDQAPGGDEIAMLEHDLRQSIRHAAEVGCDPYGGMMGDAQCAAHVMHIREQVAKIQHAELDAPDTIEALQAMYVAANCDGREQRHVVRLGDEVELARGSVVSIAPDDEAAEEPDAARFAPHHRFEPESQPAPDASVRTSSIHPAPVAHVVSEPMPIPAGRRDVRVIGSRFLTDAESTRTFKTIATSELDLPNSVFNSVISWFGFDEAASTPSPVAEATPSTVATAAN